MSKFTRGLRRIAHPARDTLLRPFAPLLRVQRSVPLRSADFTVKRDRKHVPDESLDLVFLDADHSEQAVRDDIRAWLPKVRRGGVIAGHDYGSRNHTGVKVAVDEAFGGRREPVRLEANKVWWTVR